MLLPVLQACRSSAAKKVSVQAAALPPSPSTSMILVIVPANRPKDPTTMPVEDPQSLTRIYNPQIASDLGITLSDDYQAIEQ